MAPVSKSHDITTVAAGIQGVTTPSDCTTLYDLITAIQEVVGVDDRLVVATVVQLLRSGRLTFPRKARAYLD
jgi:hypothetical protein